jgi:hypothetical protein
MVLLFVAAPTLHGQRAAAHRQSVEHYHRHVSNSLCAPAHGRRASEASACRAVPAGSERSRLLPGRPRLNRRRGHPPATHRNSSPRRVRAAGCFGGLLRGRGCRQQTPMALASLSIAPMNPKTDALIGAEGRARDQGQRIGFANPFFPECPACDRIRAWVIPSSKLTFAPTACISF